MRNARPNRQRRRALSEVVDNYLAESLEPRRLLAAIASGQTATGSIGVVGETDEYTFSANTGDTIAVAIGDTGNAPYDPMITIIAPDATTFDSAFGEVGTNAFKVATQTGTYTIRVTDRLNTQTGNYALTLAKIPGTHQAGGDSGTIVSGEYRTGTIGLGDIDIYTIQGTAGGQLIAAIGDTGATAFTPEIVAYSPTGTQLTFGFGDAGANMFTATSTSGTYTVVVIDRLSVNTGAYALTVVSNPGTGFSDADSATLAQSGTYRTGTIDSGDMDVYRITGTAGGYIFAAVGDTGSTAFTPEIVLYNPAGAQVDFAQGDVGTNMFTATPTTGTYTLVVFDRFSINTGTYALTVGASTGVAPVTDADSVAVQSGEYKTGTTDLGDIDFYRINGLAGGNLLASVGDLGATAYTPEIVLYSPTGAQLSFAQGDVGGNAFAATSTDGVYTVVVFDRFSINTGSYALTLVAAPTTPIVDEDSATTTSGVYRQGHIDLGDMDVYRIDASMGGTIAVAVGDTEPGFGDLIPEIVLYSPTGVQLDFAQSPTGTSIFRSGLAASGTYTIAVFDRFSTSTGYYGLTAVVVPATHLVDDDSKPILSGQQVFGTIDMGDIDTYTITIAAETSIVATLTDLTLDASYIPEVVIYGPTGAQLNFGQGADGTEASATNLAAGTYTLVVIDRFSAVPGQYALSVANPSAAVNNQGDDGGALVAGVARAGSISVGDLDIYTFSLTPGSNSTVNLLETTSGDGFDPVLWLFNPSGASIQRLTNPVSTSVNINNAVAGTYTAIVYDAAAVDTGPYSIVLGGATSFDNFGPRVISSEYRFNTSPNPPQLRVIFSEDVSASFVAGDVTLMNLDTGLPVSAANLQIDYVPGRDHFTVTFKGAFTDGILPDGNYSLRINAASIADAAGNPLNQNLAYDFFVLGGDANRDKTVNDADYAIWNANQNKRYLKFSAGDYNFNGVVGFDDYTIMATNFSKTLGPIGSINGTVYNDSNSNGTKDGAEAGLAGRTVYIDVNSNNVFDANEPSRTTSATGAWSFAAVGPGNYNIRHVLAAGNRKTQPGAGVPGYNLVQAVSQNAFNVNFGNTTNILLAGTVYNDVNSNGVKDAGEAGIAGVVININSPAGGATVAARTTDANGFWQVKGLSAGSGEAVAIVPAGFVAINPATAKYVGSMTSGQQNANLNFAMHKTSPAPFASGTSAIIASDDTSDDDLIVGLV